jgi:carboxyl-terminal processing protease
MIALSTFSVSLRRLLSPKLLNAMNLFLSLRWPLAVLLALTSSGLCAEELDPGQVEISVGRLLEQGHFSRKKLDDSVSKLFLKNYLEGLDYNHLYFTQKDIDQFTAKYATSLDDDVLFGNTEPAFAIYDLYKKRVDDRVAKVKELLKQKYEFASDKTIEVNRQKAAWPKDEATADQLWRDRIEGELLQEKLNKTDKDPVERLTKRYDQLVRNLRDQTKEDVVKIFLTFLAQTYDPHSEYMSKSDLDNFQINMKLSLVGIGAVLRSEDGFAQIMELVPGGPASKDGRIKVGDRVSAVAQGDKEFVDTVDMKLDKVVEMIRGKKDTVVRLQVWPVSATDPAERKIIDITRDEIKLKEQEAKAEIIEHSRPDGTQRLGVITLPSFYADMEHSGASNAKSTTKDVQVLLNRLKQEGITGLVMDLRRNGGGSLEEAVNLTGLFIKKGPVVQSIGNAGDKHVSHDRNSLLAYDGPMVVLTNRLSASASEIFAAALQDYGRAVVVGDSSTFGKGTVQTMLEIGRIMPFLGSSGNEAGALKLTIQKFYRIAGGSTQLNGVEPDIKLLSAYDHPEIGERALKGPLPYDTVDPLPFEKWEKPLFKKELRERSTARTSTDPEFGYIRQDLETAKKRLAENRISLNIEKRKTEIAEDKARKEGRTAERAKIKPAEEKRYSVTLDNVSKPELQIAKNEKKPATEKGSPGEVKEAKPINPALDGDEDDEDEKPEVDAVRTEALAILTDFVDLTRNPKSATAAAK